MSKWQQVLEDVAVDPVAHRRELEKDNFVIACEGERHRRGKLREPNRRDVLDSNIPLSSSASTVVMLGVRLQN